MLDVFLILLILALVLFSVGVFQKKPMFTLFSSILFIICGGFIFFGVQYVGSSTVMDVNSTATVITNNYVSWNNPYLTIPTGSLLILFGLYLIFVSIFSLSQSVESGRDED